MGLLSYKGTVTIRRFAGASKKNTTLALRNYAKGKVLHAYAHFVYNVGLNTPSLTGSAREALQEILGKVLDEYRAVRNLPTYRQLPAVHYYIPTERTWSSIDSDAPFEEQADPRPYKSWFYWPAGNQAGGRIQSRAQWEAAVNTYRRGRAIPVGPFFRGLVGSNQYATKLVMEFDVHAPYLDLPPQSYTDPINESMDELESMLATLMESVFAVTAQALLGDGPTSLFEDYDAPVEDFEEPF